VSRSSAAIPDLHYPEQLNASRYVQDLCASLSDTQIRALIGSKPGRGKHIVVPNAGRGCGWFPATSNAESNSVAIGWAPKGHGGLKFLYSIRYERRHFEPTTVSGYPAVNTSGHAETSSGQCVVSVGVNDQRAFFAQFQPGPTAPDYSHPCGKARQAARYVIENLKEGS
jgi:hypothetical protein